MKKLILIGGTMGVGKTATSSLLKQKLNQSVFLDGDWCWDMHPFVVNRETKAMVMNNIVYQLNQFISCNEIENIIFCWVMHEQSIIDEILSRVDINHCHVYTFSLICSDDTLKAHLQADIDAGIRSQDIIERSLERMKLYKQLNTIKIDISHSTIDETAEKIYKILNAK